MIGELNWHPKRLLDWGDWLLTGAAVLLLSAPAIFTQSSFAIDFTNHLWLVDVAGKNLWATGHPTYFLNAAGNGLATDANSFAPIGVFNPFFAFYGGTLYTLVGAVSQIVGSPQVAYVGFITFMILSCYRGAVLLARHVGVSRWLSHLPALTVVTSAYFVTNLYGRGAWPEFVASAALVPVCACGVSVVKGAGWRSSAAVGLAFYTMLMTGSHNITMVWGTTVTCAAILVFWASFGFCSRLPWRRIGLAVLLVVLGCALNAWFLLPDSRFNGFTQAHFAFGGVGAMFLSTLGILAYPFRVVPSESTTPALYTEAPVWFLGWAVIAAGSLLTRRTAPGALRRAWLACVVLTVALLIPMTTAAVWNIIPFPWNTIQFPYRLDTYLSDTCAASVAVAALALQRAWPQLRLVVQRFLAASLGIVVAVSVVLCAWQLWVPSDEMPGWSLATRSLAVAHPLIAPRTWYDHGLYADASAPVVSTSATRTLVLNPADVRGDFFSRWLTVPAGMAPIQTNIAGGGYLARLAGLVPVGRNLRGFLVVRREAPGSGRVHLTIQTDPNTTIESGRVISLLALLTLLVIVFAAGVRNFGNRRLRWAGAG